MEKIAGTFLGLGALTTPVPSMVALRMGSVDVPGGGFGYEGLAHARSSQAWNSRRSCVFDVESPPFAKIGQRVGSPK